MRGGNEREGDLKSLCLFPILMGIGHLPPAIGALQTVGGKSQNEIALLVMMASTTVMVDCKSSLTTRCRLCHPYGRPEADKQNSSAR